MSFEILTGVEAMLTSVETILTSVGLVLIEVKGYWDVSGCVGICRIMVTDIKMVLTSVRMMTICVGAVLVRNNRSQLAFSPSCALNRFPTSSMR